MSLDSSTGALLEMVQALVSEDLEGLLGNVGLQEDTRQMMFRWAGADAVAFSEAMDAIMARLLLQVAGGDLFSNTVSYDLASDIHGSGRH